MLRAPGDSQVTALPPSIGRTPYEPVDATEYLKARPDAMTVAPTGP